MHNRGNNILESVSHTESKNYVHHVCVFRFDSVMTQIVTPPLCQTLYSKTLLKHVYHFPADSLDDQYEKQTHIY